MEFDNSFEVPLPPAEAWKVLLDIEGIAPCMPGAQLTEVLGEHTYKGHIAVRLGPVALTFAGIVKFDEIDASNLVARVSAQGTDAKGRGGAHAVSAFRLEPTATGSKVLVHTNLNLSGAVAQYGRGVGIIQATAGQLINQFAKCLKDKLAQRRSSVGVQSDGVQNLAQPAVPQQPLRPMPPASPSAKPIAGFALLAKIAWSWLVGLFRRS